MLGGVIASPLYLISCVLINALQIDDPIEGIQIFILPIIWSAINSALFEDKDKILIPELST